MADTPKLTVGTDLAIVVNGDCGCFCKFYFELEANNVSYVDRDINPCKRHLQSYFIEVSTPLAKAEADRIRSKVNQ